jgi:demethylmenaquinone methyltransferase/2-methoxy-6-polyprenyl-1,4-benzoquinol methylase
LPLVGSIGTGDKKAYYYLRDSVNNFMSKKQLKEKYNDIGFKGAEYIPLTFGVASIHYGTK